MIDLSIPHLNASSQQLQPLSFLAANAQARFVAVSLAKPQLLWESETEDLPRQNRGSLATRCPWYPEQPEMLVSKQWRLYIKRMVGEQPWL